MVCAVKLCNKKLFLALMILFGWTDILLCNASSRSASGELQTFVSYELIEGYDQDKDDELLIKEIWGIGATAYKSIIDMSALYFSGILLDAGQLYDRMMFDLGKSLFQVIKLLAWYGPKMIQNPNISWKTKAKKTAYITSFFVFFLLWSREISRQKQYKNISGQEDLNASFCRSVGTDFYLKEELYHRPQRPIES